MAKLIYRIPKVFLFFLSPRTVKGTSWNIPNVKPLKHQNWSNKNTAEYFSRTKILAIYFINETNNNNNNNKKKKKKKYIYI